MVKFRLKLLRVEREISQIELEKISGIRRPTLSAIENNSIKTIKVEHIDKLCRVLDCTPADLIVFKK